MMYRWRTRRYIGVLARSCDAAGGADLSRAPLSRIVPGQHLTIGPSRILALRQVLSGLLQPLPEPIVQPWRVHLIAWGVRRVAWWWAKSGRFRSHMHDEHLEEQGAPGVHPLP